MTTRPRWPCRAAVVAVTAAVLLAAGCAPVEPAGARGAGAAGARPPTTGAARAGSAAGPGAAPGTPAVTGRDPWAPRPGLRWQIQLAGDVVATGVPVYDLDPYATAEQTVAELHATGAVVMCHLDVGVADMRLPDAARLPADALGPPARPAGRWLDIRRWDLIAPVLAARLDLCRSKGFDAVDADHADTYARVTGLPLAPADQVAYDLRVAGLARAAGLAVGERTGPALAGRLLPELDFAVVDGCVARADCAAWAGYVDAGKAVFDVETHQPAGVCARARVYGFTVTLARPDLGAAGTPC